FPDGDEPAQGPLLGDSDRDRDGCDAGLRSVWLSQRRRVQHRSQPARCPVVFHHDQQRTYSERRRELTSPVRRSCGPERLTLGSLSPASPTASALLPRYCLRLSKSDCSRIWPPNR